MKILFSALLVLSFFVNSQATMSMIPDTSHKPWRIDQKQFMDRYGKDDTSRALIQYWFYDRETGFIITSITGLGSGLFGTAAIYGAIKKDGLIVLAATIIGIPLLVLTLISVLFLTTRSRKKLYRMLQDY